MYIVTILTFVGFRVFGESIASEPSSFERLNSFFKQRKEIYIRYGVNLSEESKGTWKFATKTLGGVNSKSESSRIFV